MVICAVNVEEYMRLRCVRGKRPAAGDGEPCFYCYYDRRRSLQLYSVPALIGVVNSFVLMNEWSGRPHQPPCGC